MKRIIILEKTGDYLRQYWILPELDYPPSPTMLEKLIEYLINHKRIDLVKYNKEANVRVIPWIWDEGVTDLNTGKAYPVTTIFPYPRFNIKNMQSFRNYNTWLKKEYKEFVTKLVESKEKGWEKIQPEYIDSLIPMKVSITQAEIDRLEYLISIDD